MSGRIEMHVIIVLVTILRDRKNVYVFYIFRLWPK